MEISTDQLFQVIGKQQVEIAMLRDQINKLMTALKNATASTTMQDEAEG